MDRDLLGRLKVLETDLHRLETRRNRAQLERLLHPDFVEFGRSGRRYDRSEVLAEFSEAGAALEPVYAEHFEILELGRGSALLTYVSAHKTEAGKLHRRTLRSSLWLETETGWQMRFHQGTAADGAT
jgi:hypothetical protein